MSQSCITQQLESKGEFKSYSCLTCRQRKVKCDRRSPCSNCVRAEKQCSFIAPVRGKRKRLKPPKEGLHAKLRRYEELLRSFGVKIELSQDSQDSGSETASQPDVESNQDASPRFVDHTDPFGLEETKPKLITEVGASRYFDSAPWSKLGDEHPEVGGLDEPMAELDLHESEMFIEPERRYDREVLAGLHPSFQTLLLLKEIYIDRVDPLVKVLHLPTFWTTLTDELQTPLNLSRSLEAVIFAFYLATISTLKEHECQGLFNAPKSAVYSRYRIATRQALVNAKFLSTSNLMTLRAYALFTMCVRSSYQSDTLFVLSGIAIRLARKMGLHRDGTSLGLSAFETEMRRRLWWHLVFVDYRTADVLGTRPSLDLSCGDTRLPLNINDEDLSPDSTALPPERKGLTAVTVCLIKCKTMEALQKVSTPPAENECWETPGRSRATLGEKDRVIGQLEEDLEAEYLRYCDPANPLHTFVSIMVRSSICKMKLHAHNPQQFANHATEIPQKERDIVLVNATKLLEYLTLMRGGKHGLDRYIWHIGTSFLWNSMLYVLIEVRRRKKGPEVDRLWQLIGVVFSQYPQVAQGNAEVVYKALRRWTLEVWDDYVAARTEEGFPEPATPDFISSMRSQKTHIKSPNKPKDLVVNLVSATQALPGYDPSASRCEETPLNLESVDSYEFSDLVSFEMDPNEWMQWEQLLSEGSSSTQVDSLY